MRWPPENSTSDSRLYLPVRGKRTKNTNSPIFSLQPRGSVPSYGPIETKPMVAEDLKQEGSVTALLRRWQDGSPAALDALLPYIYDELHDLAAAYLRRERPGHTLQPTALVNELYLRLAGSRAPDVEGRRNFYRVAARLMRQILVDHARKHLADKRGGPAPRLSLDEALSYSVERAAQFTALDDALDALARINERAARAVELRFFTGLTLEETAGVLSRSANSVGRDVRFAVAFLSRQLKSE